MPGSTAYGGHRNWGASGNCTWGPTGKGREDVWLALAGCTVFWCTGAQPALDGSPEQGRSQPGANRTASILPTRAGCSFLTALVAWVRRPHCFQGKLRTELSQGEEVLRGAFPGVMALPAATWPPPNARACTSGEKQAWRGASRCVRATIPDRTWGSRTPATSPAYQTVCTTLPRCGLQLSPSERMQSTPRSRRLEALPPTAQAATSGQRKLLSHINIDRGVARLIVMAHDSQSSRCC